MKRKFLWRVLSVWICIFLLLAMVSCTSSPPANTQVSQEVEDFLLSTGMPRETVERLDGDLKQKIYETSAGTEQKFIAVKDQDTPDSEILGGKNAIPKEELSVSLVVFSDGTQGPETVYTFYPMFEWKTPASIGNDGFAFSLMTQEQAWNIVSGERAVWVYQNQDGQWKGCGTIDSPCEADLCGFGFDGFDQVCSGKNWYKGIGYMQASRVKEGDTTWFQIGHGRGGSNHDYVKISIFPDQQNTFTLGGNPATNRYGKFHLDI